MTTDFKYIPIIDVGPLVAKGDDLKMYQDEEVREVVKQLDKACKETGFFYVKGHGIPESLIKEVKDVTHKFFDQPYEEKLKIKMTPASGYRGYQKIKENITKGVPDLQEAVDYYREVKRGMYGSLGEILEGCNQWPEHPENFKSSMEEYVRLCTDLSRKIMRGIAVALGGSADEFEGEKGGDAFWVKNLSGEWIPATPIPGTFVCNIGDMLKIWSNGIYEATLHRVINNSPKYRVSVAYFYEPNFDTLVEPLEMCVEKSGGTRLNQRAVYGEHLANKMILWDYLSQSYVAPLMAKGDDLKMGQDVAVGEVVKQLDKACKEIGFFYVKGHGIPESLMKEVKDVTHKFFNLPYDEKLKIKTTPASGYRGYQKIKQSITKGVPDLHEAVDYFKEVKRGMYGSLGEMFEGCNQWPKHPENCKSSMEEYIRLCTDLSRKIMRGIALALGGSADEFEGDRGGDPFWYLRLIGYPGISTASGAKQNDIGCGIHTDYGMLTLVNQDDDITALEVQDLYGEWIPATPIPGTFVCNIGDMLKPNFDALVEPLEMCVEKSGRPRLNQRAVYGEHLVNKVKATFGLDQVDDHM
ncbi:Isopenicillin N synthase [Corchorus olitorius]|uniref:Isopenicillin N synthase n=1 Tax=Corchorus olitorius TaxID=93759 RepID=A0A1R3K4E5_9ROSI|nr:Isopenicillin N synthase [Corchorus olitorius]